MTTDPAWVDAVNFRGRAYHCVGQSRAWRGGVRFSTAGLGVGAFVFCASVDSRAGP